MITRRKIDSKSVVIDPGRALDNSNAHEMTEVMSSLHDDGYKYIIVDMTSLEFLSSAGVGSILGAVGRSRAAGGDIILCNLSERILHILSILDLCDYLTIREDEEAARESCSVRD